MAIDEVPVAPADAAPTDDQESNVRSGRFRRLGRRQERRPAEDMGVPSDNLKIVGRDIQEAVPTQRKPGSGPFGPDDPWDVLHRHEFIERLEARLDAGQPTTLVAFGMDRFDLLNRTAGLAAGDVAIRNAYRVLRWMLGPSNVAYFGSDCYAALLSYDDDETSISMVTAALDRLARVDLSDDLSEIYATASAGIVVVNNVAINADDVLYEAECAMLAAKEKGGSNFAIERLEPTLASGTNG